MTMQLGSRIINISCGIAGAFVGILLMDEHQRNVEWKTKNFKLHRRYVTKVEPAKKQMEKIFIKWSKMEEEEPDELQAMLSLMRKYSNEYRHPKSEDVVKINKYYEEALKFWEKKETFMRYEQPPYVGCEDIRYFLKMHRCLAIARGDYQGTHQFVEDEYCKTCTFGPEFCSTAGHEHKYFIRLIREGFYSMKDNLTTEEIKQLVLKKPQSDNNFNPPAAFDAWSLFDDDN
jgi:hypothetical protein